MKKTILSRCCFLISLALVMCAPTAAQWKDNMGGSAAGRLSGGTTLGAALGAETHTHGGSTMDGPNSVNLSANGLDFNAANVVHTHALHIASDTNVQPTFILNLMIRI